MVIVNVQNAVYDPREGGIYFCSPKCLEIYRENYRSGQTAQQ